jgi:hypothetical protein
MLAPRMRLGVRDEESRAHLQERLTSLSRPVLSFIDARRHGLALLQYPDIKPARNNEIY